jgi:hypothetical protein
MRPDHLAANLVTVTDIAARTGSPEDAAELWVHLPAFPRLLVPEIASGRVWWWPDVREYILSHAAKLPGYVPPAAVKPASRPRPAGKRGADPGPRILTAFDLRVLEAMHGQVDDQERPRFTLEQIAAAMSGNVSAMTIVKYAPASRRRSGRGGDSRALEPEQIAEMRALRAETTQDEKPRYTLRQLAARFGVSDISASRYCRDIQPGVPVTPRRRRQPFDADGNPITVEQVERVQAMRAERDGAGAHRYTREQVAEACQVSVATVKRLERRLTGPPRPGDQAVEVDNPSWPQPVQRGIAAPGTPLRLPSARRPTPQRPGSTLSP